MAKRSSTANKAQPSIKLTKRQGEVILALQDGAQCFFIDTPSMCGVHPALVKGKDVKVLRRQMLDALITLDLLRHPTGILRQVSWDSYVLTEKGKAWKKSQNK